MALSLKVIMPFLLQKNVSSPPCPAYLELYRDWQVKKEYNSRVYPMIHELKRKYGLNSSYIQPIKEKLGLSTLGGNKGQGRLF